MSEKCVCGGSTAQPNEDCERCQLIATITALRTELAEAKHTIARMSFYAGQSTGEIRMLKQRVAELESLLGRSTNYVADDELYPHIVWFANGRTVSIASGGHLEIGMGGRLAACKGDVSDEP